MKLHEVVAIRKGEKARAYAAATQIYKDVQKHPSFTGLDRNFVPLDDDGEVFPSESAKVQLTVPDVLRAWKRYRAKFLDIELTQEVGNTEAKADVIVDGQTILSAVPVGYLIFLEKELSDLASFVKALPTLDDSKSWTTDPNSNLYRSEQSITHKTKKVQRPIVLYAATPEHPAQTQLVSEDVTIGHWHTTHLSGGLPLPKKEALFERVVNLQSAVKKARARANEHPIEQREVAGALFEFLFSDL